MSNVVKFPYDDSRRAHPRKQRRSKNGTPEQRAAAAAMRAEIDAGENPVIRSAQMREFERLINSLHPCQYPAALGALRKIAEPPPARRTNSEAMARKREFKAAMRERIRDVARSRDLSEEEIKPALTLKHHEIAAFTLKHGVNVEWLLEGTGPVFNKRAIKAIIREVTMEDDQ